MDRQGFNDLIQILCATFLRLPQDFDLSIEVFDLFILLFTKGLEVGIVDIEHLDGDDLVGD